MAFSKGLSSILSRSPSDVVLLSALRTPICRSYRGQLKDAYPEELLSVVLRATLDANPNLPPEHVEDVAVGVVLSELGGSKAARMAMNHVGFPNTTSLYTVNRACSSSLQSIALTAAQIRTGMINAGIAAGMESMTRNYASRAIPTDLWPELKDSPVQGARDCIMPMGITSENVAARYGVGRREQDEFAVESHRRAASAQARGLFDEEIVPVRTRFQEVDKQGNKVGDERPIEVTRDDGIRASATLEALAKLKPAFKSDGASTAGNSSQVSDGAAAAMLMRRSTAAELGLTSSIMGKFVAATVAGCAPDEMGIGPALAIPRLLGQLGLENEDVDRWEINEAFASQAIYCVRELGLEKAWEQGKVNPDGGAIALGHPLGATGARMTGTLMHGLRRTGGEVGVVSASLVWIVVLTFFVIKDYRLLLKIFRWPMTIYLIILGLVVPEILRAGLTVNAQEDLHWDAILAWIAWFGPTVLSIFDWRFLLPAGGVPVWLFSRPETRVLLNYGLVKLGWLGAFYSPMWWMMTRNSVPDVWSVFRPLREGFLTSVVGQAASTSVSVVRSLIGKSYIPAKA
ncbi:hypothetical protein DL762_000682 [Monosporascus cannonballus]|uniref:Thiolase N-terminal domain-containing protein n=1 Tax=Monosporascus cannonballus TaxID=155416 RepID=A0ABY0HIF6_9PEZI|nr:hypothetical protein DL762_000682 [Monosporascus cannonballus]